MRIGFPKLLTRAAAMQVRTRGNRRALESIKAMNRTCLLDSLSELDPSAIPRDRSCMPGFADHIQILLERREPRANVARYYVLSVEPTLFDEAALVRQWGRIGKTGRQRIELHASADAAAEALEVWLRRKLKRGYLASLGRCCRSAR